MAQHCGKGESYMAAQHIMFVLILVGSQQQALAITTINKCHDDPESIRAIERLGGTVTIDESQPQRFKTIDLNSANIEDADSTVTVFSKPL
jgi:hypothetical protein